MIELTASQREWLINYLDWDDMFSSEAEDFRQRGVAIPKESGAVKHTADEHFPYSIGTFINGQYIELDAITEGLYTEMLQH